MLAQKKTFIILERVKKETIAVGKITRMIKNAL